MILTVEQSLSGWQSWLDHGAVLLFGWQSRLDPLSHSIDRNGDFLPGQNIPPVCICILLLLFDLLLIDLLLIDLLLFDLLLNLSNWFESYPVVIVIQNLKKKKKMVWMLSCGDIHSKPHERWFESVPVDGLSHHLKFSKSQWTRPVTSGKRPKTSKMLMLPKKLKMLTLLKTKDSVHVLRWPPRRSLPELTFWYDLN